MFGVAVVRGQPCVRVKFAVRMRDRSRFSCRLYEISEVSYLAILAISSQPPLALYEIRSGDFIPYGFIVNS
eukprot:7289181-Prymnesium_polylepis.1